MKPKGIKFFELIVDKLLLGLFAMIFLVVVALQFVGGGDTLKVGSQTGVPISRAYDQIVSTARSKQALLNSSDAPAELPTISQPVSQQLAKLLANPRLDERSAPWVRLVQVVTSAGSGLAAGEIGRFAMPTAPRPSLPIARAFGGALDPYELQQHPELAQSLLGDPQEQPYDVFAVSVEASFDAGLYRSQLQTDPDGDGPLTSIPRSWWQNRMEILDVQVFRREVFTDGGVGPERLLEPAPGMASLRWVVTDDLTTGEFNARVKFAGAPANARQIRQPFFYHLIAGQPWIPPMEANSEQTVDERFVQVQSVRRQIEELEKKLTQLQSKAQAETDARRARYYASAEQPLGSGGGGGKGKKRGKGNSRSDDDAQRADQRRKEQMDKLKAQIEDLQTTERELVAQLQDAGIDPETGFNIGPSPSLLDPPARLRDVDEVNVWSHDITVTPGATYQYKMRLVLPNPLKGYERSMAADLQGLAEIAAVTSADSPWSAPLTVPRRAYMFVDRASIPEKNVVGLARPSANVELYRFYYGYWRKGEARVQAGDAIGATIELDQPLPIWGIENGDPQRLNDRTDPIEAWSGEYLLDVVAEPSPAPIGPGGREQIRYAAVIGAKNGSIAMRRPDVDANSALKRRLEASQRASLDAAVKTPGSEAGSFYSSAGKNGPEENSSPKPKARPGQSQRGLGGPG